MFWKFFENEAMLRFHKRNISILYPLRHCLAEKSVYHYLIYVTSILVHEDEIKSIRATDYSFQNSAHRLLTFPSVGVWAWVVWLWMRVLSQDSPTSSLLVSLSHKYHISQLDHRYEVWTVTLLPFSLCPIFLWGKDMKLWGVWSAWLWLTYNRSRLLKPCFYQLSQLIVSKS